jgi:hypothetical protein
LHSNLLYFTMYYRSRNRSKCLHTFTLLTLDTTHPPSAAPPNKLTSRQSSDGKGPYWKRKRSYQGAEVSVKHLHFHLHKREAFVNEPVPLHVLIIVKTHENRVEYIWQFILDLILKKLFKLWKISLHVICIDTLSFGSIQKLCKMFWVKNTFLYRYTLYLYRYKTDLKGTEKLLCIDTYLHISLSLNQRDHCVSIDIYMYRYISDFP